MRTKLLIALTAVTLAAPLAAQVVVRRAPESAPEAAVKAPFVKAEAEAAVGELATQLEDNFVFPEVGKAYAAMLRANLAAGKYSSFADSQAFAEAVTSDLQAVHKDGHLRVRAVPPEAGPAEAGTGPRRVRRAPSMASNAVSKSGWLADGVAYIRFEGFPGS